ncbi:MAG: metallophosphoesterase [Desulfobacterales bacterium]|nr:metallophosphoesterase [Desulfobacterales bacterium]
MFFAFVFVIVPLVYLYVGRRLIEPMAFTRGKKAVAWLVISFIFILPYSARYLRRYQPFASWDEILLNAGYICLGFFGILFITILTRDVLLALAWLLRKAGRVIENFHGTNRRFTGTPQNLERRRFLVRSSNLGLLALSGGLAGYGIHEAMTLPGVVRVSVPVKNLPGDLEGFRIVQLSDLHVGPTIKRKYVAGVVRIANELEPDVLVLTGDLSEGRPGALRQDVSPLSELRAKSGKLLVTGNHEYYNGIKGWLQEISRLGFQVLLNEHLIIQRGTARLLMAGVPDPQARRLDPDNAPDLRKTLKDVPECHAKILLAHRPHAIFESSQHGFDLQLSGHTHGGQIFPFNYMQLLREPYIAGLHLHHKTWIYVSRGTGVWGPPMRVGAPAEVTQISLVKA